MKQKDYETIFHEIANANCNSNQKQINKTCQCECKNYPTCDKDYSWNPNTCICENGNYFKGVIDDLKKTI